MCLICTQPISPSHIFPPHLPSSITSFFPTIPQVRSVITHYFTHICDSTARDIYLGILYGYKMVLQIIALVLAFATRKVKVKGLDDAKYIAAAIYVTSIVLAVIIVSGTTNYLFGVDWGDITFVEQYTVAKPVPVPLEFIDLVEIIMQENNLTVPQTIVDALALYIELINSVEE